MDENDSEERKSFLTQAEMYIERNDLRDVLNLAHARLKRTPGDLDARIVICRVWLLQGRLDEARDMLHEMEEILASLSHVYVCMGDICMKKGMEDSAQSFYRKFLVLNPEAPLSRDITERLKEIEELHAAEGEMETGEEAEVPSDFQTVTLAELYIRQGHLRPAEELLAKIVGNDPQNEKAVALLAQVRERLLPESFVQPDRAEADMQPYAEAFSEPVQPHAAVIAELSRWLDNIDRLRDHAA